MVGAKAEAMEPLDPSGSVKMQGEIWNAESLTGRIDKGETVLVKEIMNLKLYVEKQAT
jgi:membrane-bound serine protease (ClpP class)